MHTTFKYKISIALTQEIILIYKKMRRKQIN